MKAAENAVILWQGWLDLNQRMRESKSLALPLGYTPIKGRMMRIELTNAGATIRCVNHFATFAMAGAAGIEPTLTVLETAVLPLNYAPINGGEWIDRKSVV